MSNKPNKTNKTTKTNKTNKTQVLAETSQTLNETTQSFNEVTQSLNVWDLTAQFKVEYPDLFWCTKYKTYYIWNPVLNIWESISSDSLQNKIISWIMDKYPKNYKDFNPNDTVKILLLLQQHSTSMVEQKYLANKNGILVPFANGVLNSKTMELHPHSPNLYSTHIINVDFIPSAVLNNTPMSAFLNDIANSSKLNLQIIRAFLNIILTNNLDYQLALYLYGPGGTGKTTFTNLLQFIVGPQAAISTTLKNLNSRFGASILRDKLLCIITELPLNLNTEPPMLKNIIGRDLLNVEQKYKDPIQIISTVFVVITSNSLWQIKDSSTGIARRFAYMPFTTKPLTTKVDLFNIDNAGNPYGLLLEDIPALILWALKCPTEFIETLHRGGEAVTKLINPDSLITTNPLRAWAEECLELKDKSAILIGNNKSGSNTLYGHYINWASNFGSEVSPVGYAKFSGLLIDVLTSMNWAVSKKRKTAGYVIQGITFKPSEGLVTQDNVTKHVEAISQNDFY